MVALAHNGGRSTTNFSDLIYGQEFPFIDHMKTQEYLTVYGSPGGPVLAGEMDADGWPHTLRGLGYIGRVILPTQQQRPGRYVVRWQGNGTIRLTNVPISFHTGYSSADLTSSTGSGRVEFLPTSNAGYIDIGVSAIGSPYITNIVMYHIDDETDYNAGKVFQKRFLDRVKEANFGRLRFLSWPDNNVLNLVTWRTRMPTSYRSYGGNRYFPTGACDPALNTLTGLTFGFAAPSIDIATGNTFALADKATIHVEYSHPCPVVDLSGVMTKGSDVVSLPSHGLVLNQVVFTDASVFGLGGFRHCYVVDATNPNSVKMSLTQGGSAIVATYNEVDATKAITVSPAVYHNVGGTGAKIVRSPYGTGLSSGGNSYPQNTDFRVATLTFDADLDCWIKHGGSAGFGNTGVIAGVPPELMIMLCAEVGAHPHFVMPRLAVSPMTDWTSELATLCRDTGPNWFKPAFEPPNELWNITGGFFNGAYGLAKAQALWNLPDFNHFYGKVMSTIGQAVHSVYSNDRSRFDVILAVQTARADTLGGTGWADERADSTEYVNQAAAAQSGYTKSAAKNWVTSVGVANYFSPNIQPGSSEETAASNSFAACFFKGSVSGFNLTVDETAFGTLAVGKRLFDGPGIPAGGVNIVGGSAPNWVLDKSLEISSGELVAGNFAENDVSNYAASAASGGLYTADANLTFFQNWKTWAISKGIYKLCGYEGGYSPDVAASIDFTIALWEFRLASKFEPVVQTITTQVANYFMAQNGDGFVAEYPASYFATGNPAWAVWPCLDDVWSNKYSPGFEAWKAFNTTNRARSLRRRLFR